MKSFRCKICGVKSIGSSNKMYCSPACKQKAHRMKSHPFSGEQVKVKRNAKILSDVAHSIHCASKVSIISEDDVYPLLIRGLKDSGFLFPNDDIENKTFDMLLDFEVKKSECKRSIYCALFSDGLVKIGYSIDVELRLRTIEGQSGRSLCEYVSIEIGDKLSASNVEAEILKSLNEFRLKGEWFKVDYKLAKDRVFAYAEKVRLPRLI